MKSGPLMYTRTIPSEEKDISDSSKSLSALERKLSGDTDGLKIALWALRMRSATSDFSVMVSPSPNWIPRATVSSVGQPQRDSAVHGASEWVSWHSVGHLIPYVEVFGARYL
jgi:hypothetical protein